MTTSLYLRVLEAGRRDKPQAKATAQGHTMLDVLTTIRCTLTEYLNITTRDWVRESPHARDNHYLHPPIGPRDPLYEASKLRRDLTQE